jgi:DNA-binding NtrC family response regulator
MERLQRAPEQPSRILLVDDEEPLLRATTRMLAFSGYQVTAFTSAAAALKQLSSDRYDAMLSDIRMPGMDGIQLLRAAREHDLDLPVVLITGTPDLASARAAVE